MDITIVFLMAIVLLGGAGAAWFMMQMNKRLMEQMDRMNQQIDRRLSENVRAMAQSEQSVRSVSLGLGKLEQATASLQQTGNEIVSFQHLLKAPKIRGSFGEVLLGNLLADVLPQDRYELQYTFADSREIADAIIRLQDGYIVAIDAKFPFANYEAFMKEQDKEERSALRKIFIRDVKKHISDISQKYISSHEKTLDYAFMYIPIEGVYYETMVQGDGLWDFCLQHKVVPVSPNSFLAYLQTVLVGLRGMKIEQKTREILSYIGTLRQDFGKFSDDFLTVGKHLSNAKTKYEDSNRRLDKLSNRFEQIEVGDAETPQLPSELL
jgi:DNA recombination protein RmuC